MRITTMREPGAAWAGRTCTAGELSVFDAEAHAVRASAQARRASAPLTNVLGLDAVERVDDQIGRVTEVEGNGRPAVLHRLEHRRAELDPRRAQPAGLRVRAPGERP